MPKEYIYKKIMEYVQSNLEHIQYIQSNLAYQSIVFSATIHTEPSQPIY